MPYWVITRYGNLGQLPDIAVNFATDQCWDKRFGSQNSAAMWTCARTAGTGNSGFDYAVNSAGVWTPFAINTLRRTDLGLTVEEQRTNSLPNNSMSGLVASTQVLTAGQIAITSITRVGTTATLTTASPHGLSSNNLAIVTGATPNDFNGGFIVTVTGASTFTYLMGADPGSDASPVGQFEAWTAGTAPTSTNFTATSFGMARLLIGTGTESGLTYLDIRYVGTPWTTGNKTVLYSNTTSIAALPGQTWFSSQFARVAGGSMSNLTASVYSAGYTAAVLAKNTNQVSITAAFTASSAFALGTQRWPTTALGLGLLDNTVVWAAGGVFVTPVAAGTPIDITVRTAAGQLENCTAALTAISTTAAKATAGSTYVNGATTFTVTGGTGTAAVYNVTIAANALASVDSVSNAGSYTVPPTPNASGEYVGTVASGNGDGLATVTITWTDNKAKAFASTPIITSAGAATRNADKVSMTSVPSFGDDSLGSTLYVAANKAAPVTYTLNSVMLRADHSSGSDLFQITTNSGDGTTRGQMTVNSGVVTTIATTAWAPGAVAKAAYGLITANRSISYNGGAVNNSASAYGVFANPMNRVFVGSNNGGAVGSAVFPELAIWTQYRLTDANLRAVST